MSKILFLPSHVGLGHVTRDYVIAKILRENSSDIYIEWCSAEPAKSFLKIIGEHVIDECTRLKSFSTVIEDLYNGKIHNILDLGSRLKILKENYEIIREILETRDYDLIFADEFWEVVYAAPIKVKKKIVFGTDILYKPYSLNLLDSFISYTLNHYFKNTLPKFQNLTLLNDIEYFGRRRWYMFFGEPLTEWIKKNMYIAGLATSFLPDELSSSEEARRKLGFEKEEFIIVVSIGGTSTRSKTLLECIDNASQFLTRKISEITGLSKIRLVVLPGPRTIWEPKNTFIDIRKGLIPRLLDYYAAGDLFISRAGRTSTADLLCLGKPAIFIPIKEHFEQEEIAKDINKRFHYPILDEDKCTPKTLTYTIKHALTQQYKPDKNLCKGTIITAKLLISMIKN